jgi:leucine-rich repeat protein SHOC2
MTLEELVSIVDRSKKDRSTHLDLYQQQIESLPDSIGNLTNLVSLRCVDNRLTSLPDSIGNLTNLRELRLYKNQLKNLPDNIANLQNLTWLSLSLNRLRIFPESIISLTNLTGLLLNGNQLTVLPTNIDRLANLTYLDITGNPLIDLSILQHIPKLKTVKFWNVDLPRKFWIDLKAYPHALQLSLGEIVELEIKSRDFKHLNRKSLIRLPENLENDPPKLSTKINNQPSSIYDRLIDLISLKSKETIPIKDLNRHLHLSKNKLTSLPFNIGKLTNLTCLDLRRNQLTSLPASIGNLNNLTHLDLQRNKLSFLPASIDNLTNLTHLHLNGNLLVSLPNCLDEMKNLTHLHVNSNRLTSLQTVSSEHSKLIELHASRNNLDCLPLNLSRFTQLKNLDISHNKFTTLPNNVGDIVELVSLNLADNKLIRIPASISSLKKLTHLYLSGNPLEDLSILQELLSLQSVDFFGVNLPRRYWTKLSEWKAEWLLDERNVELRRRLIERLGYEQICQELGAIQLDTWREYTLLKIDGVEQFYDRRRSKNIKEPMVLLKMTCPSTEHVHILRVPPEMTSAEVAITWVNHGIHPDKFTIQT